MQLQNATIIFFFLILHAGKCKVNFSEIVRILITSFKYKGIQYQLNIYTHNCTSYLRPSVLTYYRLKEEHPE